MPDFTKRRAAAGPAGRLPVYLICIAPRSACPRPLVHQSPSSWLGAATFGLLLPRATFTPVLPLLILILLSSLTSAFKVRFPIASGTNMTVSYVVDIAALILRGPHATMIVGAVSGWTQSTFNAKEPNPTYRTLFNMSILVITIQASGQVFQLLGGSPTGDLAATAVPLAGMALTYFIVNTIPIAIAISLTTNQNAWQIWKGDFASSFPSYLLGAIAAAVIIAVTQTSGYWLAILLMAAPLYLTYKMYRAGVEVEARQGAILEAAHDAIITIDQNLNIREFNPAAEQMFGYSRNDILGRNIALLLPPADRAPQLSAFSRYLTNGDGPLARRRLELAGQRADGTEFPVELTVARLGADSKAIITGFVRDITERRLLEDQLRQSQKLEAIGRLAGGVAHDFNNILMSIIGSADLMLMQTDLNREQPATKRRRSSGRSSAARASRASCSRSASVRRRGRSCWRSATSSAAWIPCCAG